MGTSIEVTITPATGRFDADDDRWLKQIADLMSILREDAGTVSQRQIVEPGAKGDTSEVVLALTSAGTLTAAVKCFQSWLKRDKTRILTLTWTDDTGTQQTATVTGDQIDQASFQTAVEALGKRLER